MSKQYDVIVVGVGTMGVSACTYLAKAGLNVLGLEQFTIPNEYASHSGFSRVIRKAYYEHPDYVPLLLRSYDLWRELEDQHGVKLYYETGILYLGPPTSVVINGCLESSRLYNIPIERWPRDFTIKKYPQFTYPKNWLSLWEPEAGYLDIHASLKYFAQSAIHAGATIHTNEEVISWNQTEHGIHVQTPKNIYNSKKIIFTSGAWTNQILAKYQMPLVVTRQSMTWLDTDGDAQYVDPQFPCWFIHDPEKGMYYGFPDTEINEPDEPKGIKFGLHISGIPSHPDTVDRQILKEDEQDANEFTAQYLPNLSFASRTYKTCMYTNTPDEHFIIDYLPETNFSAIFACGFSGHGFKFAPVIGELLTDMALEVPLKLNIDFLTLHRFNSAIHHGT